MRVGAISLLLLTGCALPGDRYTPLGRPWVGTPAVTVPVDRTEVELGWAQGEDSDRTAFLGAHWGASPQTEVYVDALPHRRLPEPRSGEGRSDTKVGVLHRFFDETALIPAGAFGFAVRVPTGDDEKGLSSGEIDAIASIVASQHFGRVLGAFVYELELAGQESGSKVLHRAILDLGVGLGPGLGLIFEAVGSADIEADEEDLDLLGGLEFVLDPDTVFDVFAALPAADDGGGWTIGVGATIRLGGS